MSSYALWENVHNIILTNDIILFFYLNSHTYLSQLVYMKNDDSNPGCRVYPPLIQN